MRAVIGALLGGHLSQLFPLRQEVPWRRDRLFRAPLRSRRVERGDPDDRGNRRPRFQELLLGALPHRAPLVGHRSDRRLRTGGASGSGEGAQDDPWGGGVSQVLANRLRARGSLADGHLGDPGRRNSPPRSPEGGGVWALRPSSGGGGGKLPGDEASATARRRDGGGRIPLLLVPRRRSSRRNGRHGASAWSRPAGGPRAVSPQPCASGGEAG